MAGIVDLEFKWTSARQVRGPVEAYDLSQATARAFYLVFSHRDGEGASSVDITAVGAFEDVADCLAYLRYYALPEMLDWQATFEQSGQDGSGSDGSEGPSVVDVESLAATLEAGFEMFPDEDALADLRSSWNASFGHTNPGSTIEAWGSLAAFMRSPWVEETLLDEDDEGLYPELLAGLAQGTVDPEDHSDFARILDALTVLERF